MSARPRVAVLGPGGVGGLLAALLARSGASVICLARPATVARLTAEAVRVESRQFGSFSVPVVAAEQLTEPVDVCLVCVKATQLEAALDRLPHEVLGSALLVPLLNGIEHVAVLRRRYPQARVVPAAIRVESTRIRPGVIRHDSPIVAVDLAAVGELAAPVRQLAARLEAAGVMARVSDDEGQVLWSKLTFLAPLALLTTAAQASAGEVRDQRRADLLALIGEVTAVARAHGAAVDEEQVRNIVDAVPAGLRSSMQRDAEAGRPLELDAIGGAVIRFADRAGIAVPLTVRYVDELRRRYPRQTVAEPG